MLSKDFIALMVLWNFISLGLKMDFEISFFISTSPGKVFVGNVGRLTGFEYSSAVSTSCAMVVVGSLSKN